MKFLFLKKLIPSQQLNEYDYISSCKTLKLDTLQLRRIISDVKFTVNSFTKKVDSYSYIHNYNFMVPAKNTRQHTTFKAQSSRSEIGKNSIFNRLMNNFNIYCNDPDIIHVTRIMTVLKTLSGRNSKI